jgi:hypothetical protein
MVLLGVARGAGGLVLVSRGAAVDSNIQATAAAVTTVGTVLLVLGLVHVVAAVGVFRRLRWAWLLGIISTVAFVIDGAINGSLLYGRPGDRGTVVNVLVAVLITTCLFLGRSALRQSAAQQGAAASGPAAKRSADAERQH